MRSAYLSLDVESDDEADRIYKLLTEGGNIFMQWILRTRRATSNATSAVCGVRFPGSSPPGTSVAVEATAKTRERRPLSRLPV